MGLLVFSQSLINMPGVFTEDVSTQKGLGLFNKFLSDKTYVSGYAPSADDFELLDKFNEAPPTKFCNVARWYNHIKSVVVLLQKLKHQQQQQQQLMMTMMMTLTFLVTMTMMRKQKDCAKNSLNNVPENN